jgi:hypothetical protein
MFLKMWILLTSLCHTNGAPTRLRPDEALWKASENVLNVGDDLKTDDQVTVTQLTHLHDDVTITPASACLNAVESHFSGMLMNLQMFGASMMIGNQKLGTILQDKEKFASLLQSLIQGTPPQLRAMVDSFLCSSESVHIKDIDFLNQECGKIPNAILLSCPKEEEHRDHSENINLNVLGVHTRM